jgi:DNA-binding transcriptional LysR family regulator
MASADLSELAAFVAVAAHRSFRRASIERGTTPSALSHALRNLEARVGVRLLNRTTRSVSLTEAGARLFARLQPAFQDIGSAVEVLNLFRDTPYGTVRLTVPGTLAVFILGDILGPVLKQNPGLKIEVSATDRLVDIAGEGFDAGVRFGEMLSQDMIAVRIKPAMRVVVVGSPAYFRDHPPPLTPRDLQKHVCIRYRYPSGLGYQWEFERAGEKLEVDVDGPLTLDHQELMVAAAIQGIGLTYVAAQRAKSAIARGELVPCLEDWCGVEDPLFLYYPSRKHLSSGLRVMIDALRANA